MRLPLGSFPTMALRFILPPQVKIFHHPNRIPCRRAFSSPLCVFYSSSLSATVDSGLSYEPSLKKGRELPEISSEEQENEDGSGGGVIDKSRFSRVFDVRAIRVPAEDCYALESRLRGHLLNWPRIRNIARVPGDEIDDDMRKLLWEGEIDREEALLRRMGKDPAAGELSPVLYREKLEKLFNCRGFINFRHLAKISRPKNKRNVDRKREGRKKSDFVSIEVVEEGGDGEDWSGLLGEDHIVGRWRGSTRLLLLDERYASKSLDELPQAVKVVLKEASKSGKESVVDLVKCKLTLFYDYWQTTEILEELLPKDIITPASFETVGRIAHLNLRDEHLPYRKVIGQAILDKNGPKIKTVVNKIDCIQNDYRTMQLEVLAGNHSLVTCVIENGIFFHVDLATVNNFASSLRKSVLVLVLCSYYAMAYDTDPTCVGIISSFSSSDVVCDVFSGVGPIAIAAAKKVKYVYANDLNPVAVEYLERNLVRNKLERKVEVFNMDGRRFIESVFELKRPEHVTQVVMNLPQDAVEFLDAFRGILRSRSQQTKEVLPKIHVYGFSKASDPEFDLQERIRTVLCEEVIEIEMHRVRLVAPGKWMLCASFLLPRSVACVRTKEFPLL